jgi:transposase
VDQRIEPEDTNCPTPECGQPMVRVGEDISERLDIVPAQFFVQRQIRGKWACRCCQLLVQEPAAPQVFDNALPTPGLQAHTVISRFVDHIPYYRQEQINARSGVHTPRSTLAAWSGHTGAQLMPLYDAHRAFVLSSRIVHADETPISLLDPGAGKTRRAYMWAYARGAYEPEPGVVFDFCLGRGGKYPTEFLTGWSGTLVVDAYGGYDAALALGGRSTAYCVAHARRYFDELVKANASPVAAQAIQRIAWHRIRPRALGRKNWLFIGSQLAGERAAVVMSLLQSAKLNGHEPWAYLKDILTRMPTQLNSRIEELLPHRWEPAG